MNIDTTSSKAPETSFDKPPMDRSTNNMPPMGDIKLKKQSGTFNTYTLTLSYGQLEAIRLALEQDHSNPVSDELLSLWTYYLDTLPGPGEEEEDLKAREEHPAAAADEEGDFPIPMPPREEGGAPEAEPPTPTGKSAPAPAGEVPLPEPGMEPEPAGEAADRRLAKPPRE